VFAALEGLSTLKSTSDWDIARADFAYLGFMSVFYMALVFFLEFLTNRFPR